MSNQVMELRRSQMENMVTQANSILQMYDEIVETKTKLEKQKQILLTQKMNFYLYTKEIKKEFEDFKTRYL